MAAASAPGRVSQACSAALSMILRRLLAKRGVAHRLVNARHAMMTVGPAGCQAMSSCYCWSACLAGEGGGRQGKCQRESSVLWQASSRSTRL